MIVILMSLFYHGLVIQRGPWENQYIAQPSYIAPPSSVVGGASPIDSPLKSGLIPNLDRQFDTKISLQPGMSKTNLHLMNK
jgi:hypothetical protein